MVFLLGHPVFIFYSAADLYFKHVNVRGVLYCTRTLVNNIMTYYIVKRALRTISIFYFYLI